MRKKPKSKQKKSKKVGIQLKAAQSLTEYIDIVDTLTPSSKNGLWFRGQSNAGYQLTPGALRDLKPLTDGYGRPVNKGQIVTASGGTLTGIDPERMLAAFKRQARPFLEAPPTNDFEWMFVAQHHGLPTRLLDWSTNALIALFFAISSARISEGDGREFCKSFLTEDHLSDNGSAVFVIDPEAFNKEASDIPHSIDVSNEYDAWSHYLDPVAAGLKAYAPICVLAPHIASRIRAQSGTFTLHGYNVWPIDYYEVLQPLITKIFIPNTATLSIRQSLKTVGITNSFVFPSLDATAKDILDEEILRHSMEV